MEKNRSDFEKRMKTLSDIAVEIVNKLAEEKIDNIPINVADIYFVLSKALQQVSVLNLAEIKDFKRRNESNKLAV
jgi:uncharacterized protein YjgD (DUF1641 family)